MITLALLSLAFAPPTYVSPTPVATTDTSTPAAAPATPAPKPMTTATPTTAGDVTEGGAVAPHLTKILVLDVRSGDLTPGQIETLSSLIAARVARYRSASVVSSADLRQLVELEVQKQQVGCDDGTNSCLAELAGALGADLVVASRAGKLGSTYVFTSQVFDPRKADAVGRLSIEAYELDELVKKVGPGLDDVLRSVLLDEPSGPTPLSAREKDARARGMDPALHTALLWGGVGGAAVGVVSAIGGAVPAILFNKGKGDLATLTRSYDGTQASRKEAAVVQQNTLDAATAYDSLGRWFLVGGTVLAVVGAAAVTTAVLLPATATEETP